MKKTHVYLAGPMSGYPDYNRPAFHEAAKHLRKLHKDWKIFNPAELDEALPLPANAPVTDYYRRDFEFLKDAELMVVLPGWKNSTGAVWETGIAHNLFRISVLALPDLRKLTPQELPNIAV